MEMLPKEQQISQALSHQIWANPVPFAMPREPAFPAILEPSGAKSLIAQAAEAANFGRQRDIGRTPLLPTPADG
jgi:hypothetical protein